MSSCNPLADVHDVQDTLCVNVVMNPITDTNQPPLGKKGATRRDQKKNAVKVEILRGRRFEAVRYRGTNLGALGKKDRVLGD